MHSCLQLFFQKNQCKHLNYQVEQGRLQDGKHGMSRGGGEAQGHTYPPNPLMSATFKIVLTNSVIFIVVDTDFISQKKNHCKLPSYRAREERLQDIHSHYHLLSSLFS